MSFALFIERLRNENSARLPGSGGVSLCFVWKMASGPFTLAQLADAADISIADVRLYRDSGLLQPPRRQRGRTDDICYRAEHLERLRLIKRALDSGFSLEDIAKIVGGHGLTTCNDVYRIAVHRLETLRCDRGSDDAMVAALATLIASCAGKGSRSDCQILLTLAKPDPKD